MVSTVLLFWEYHTDFDHLVSFPHYFLQATGHLAEQLKTREWIVARITSITERVVDPKVCMSESSYRISLTFSPAGPQ